ncbi:MAG: cation-translocating P-type ATPase [Flammeovirgaceae bacterium]
MENEISIDSLTGLTSQQAKTALDEFGYNELPLNERKRFLKIILGVIMEPMFVLLLACFGIYLFLGDWTEAVMLLGFVAISIVITVYQENKTEKSLEALKDLSSPRALVIRDGHRQRIPGREVVTNDLIFLQEGDRVPADGELLWFLNLSIDESILTGESMAVRKGVDKPGEGKLPDGEKSRSVFSSTLVVSGQGIARVVATGINTEVGKIGKALHQVEEEKSPLQRETYRIVRLFSGIGLMLSLLLTLVFGLVKSQWLHGVLAGITLAMGLLPEEFTVILAVFLALGAWRMSRQHVLTRKTGSIETLGSITTLCVDKTGTLTENKMSVRELFVPSIDTDPVARIEHGRNTVIDARLPLPLDEDFHTLVEYAVLASKRDPFDPMEKALVELIAHHQIDSTHDHPDRKLLKEYPLQNSLLVLSYAWKLKENEKYIVGAKGAPEAILEVCHVSQEATRAVVKKVSMLTGSGLRVLGVARASSETLPADQHDFVFEFLGLIAWEDPIRPSVPAAVKECYNAGIEIKMITGDYVGTAESIARQAGLRSKSTCVGSVLEQLSPDLLLQSVKSANVFARMVPEQKLKLVKALQQQNEVVAMTGDGVNDAPSLKAAHVGIAMGARGTDVAREAAHLVLLEDDFTHIVAAIRMGRRIYDNIRKAMAYVVAIHVPIAGLSILPILLDWPMILFPAHILFLEMIVDPACSLVFEQEKGEHDIMQRAPRKQGGSLFSKRVLVLSLAQGALVFALTFTAYAATLWNGSGSDVARAFCFGTLVVCNVFLILCNRRWDEPIWETMREQNRASFWVVTGTIVLLISIFNVPWLSHVFKFGTLGGRQLILMMGVALFATFGFELIKYISYKKAATTT